MKKATAAIGVCVAFLIICSGCFLAAYWRGIFYDMPPGYTLVTDGERYTHQDSDGHIAWVVSDSWAIGAKSFAWYCYLDDIRDGRDAAREWEPVL